MGGACSYAVTPPSSSASFRLIHPLAWLDIGANALADTVGLRPQLFDTVERLRLR